MSFNNAASFLRYRDIVSPFVKYRPIIMKALNGLNGSLMTQRQINQSINQSINFYGGLSNKKLPQGPRKERKLI